LGLREALDRAIGGESDLLGGRTSTDMEMEKTREKAEGVILSGLRGKKRDGLVSRRFNRPLSIRLSRYLARYPITPNQISFISFLLCILAAVLFATGGYVTLLLGGILAQFASIVDGCDGEIARLKFQKSAYGGWFDAVLDRYADAFLLFGLTWHAYTTDTQPLALFAGFMAILGSFMVSYTADKYDALMASKIKGKIRIGRDIRIYLIFFGALLNQAFWVLVVIAAIMNAETIRRILVCRPMNNLKRLKDEIRSIISRSKVPEDPVHAQNTLEWLLNLKPGADEPLLIAALGHDIERAMEDKKVRRDQYDDFDDFKAAHAENSARILKKIMEGFEMEKDLIEEVFRLVCHHETGGDPRSDLIRDADALSFFEVNLPMYLEREGAEKALERCRWGYKRLSTKYKGKIKEFNYDNQEIHRLLRILIV